MSLALSTSHVPTVYSYLTVLHTIHSHTVRISYALVCWCLRKPEDPPVIGMAFARRKPRRDLSITSEFEWVNSGCPASAEGGGDGGHVRGDSVGGEAVGEDFQVLLEGSLNMSVRVDEGEESSVAMAKTLKSLRSTGSFSKVRSEE